MHEVQAFLAANRVPFLAGTVAGFALWDLVVHWPAGAIGYAVLGALFGDGLTGWATGDPLWEATLVCGLTAAVGIMYTRHQVRSLQRLREMSRRPVLTLDAHADRVAARMFAAPVRRPRHPAVKPNVPRAPGTGA